MSWWGGVTYCCAEEPGGSVGTDEYLHPDKPDTSGFWKYNINVNCQYLDIGYNMWHFDISRDIDGNLSGYITHMSEIQVDIH